MKTYKARCIYGYYEQYKMVTVDKRLKYCPYGQCGVRFDIFISSENIPIHMVKLISYESCVLILLKEKRMLIIDGDNIDALATFSATTKNHVGAFLKEYIPSITYQNITAALAKGESVITW